MKINLYSQHKSIKIIIKKKSCFRHDLVEDIHLLILIIFFFFGHERSSFCLDSAFRYQSSIIFVEINVYNLKIEENDFRYQSVTHTSFSGSRNDFTSLRTLHSKKF
jgi:hypothetical protein